MAQKLFYLVYRELLALTLEMRSTSAVLLLTRPSFLTAFLDVPAVSVMTVRIVYYPVDCHAKPFLQSL